MSLSPASSRRRSARALGTVTVAAAAAVTGALLSPVLTADASQGEQPHQPGRTAKNVIFINGDGMSTAHREAGRLFLDGLDGKLGMDRLPESGMLTTDSRDPGTYVTDSAAAATAWATGQKTYNGAISVDVNKNPLPILGMQAKQAGKATGLVTTAQVTDATPAAFFSNVRDRGQQSEIARQYLEVSKPDVILGGGEDWWHPAGTPGTFPNNPAEDPEEASKGTKGDLVERARTLGYTYAGDAQQLQQATSTSPSIPTRCSSSPATTSTAVSRSRASTPRTRPAPATPSRTAPSPSRRPAPSASETDFISAVEEAVAPGSRPAPRPRRPPGRARRSSPPTSRVVRSHPAGRSRPTPGR